MYKKFLKIQDFTNISIYSSKKGLHPVISYRRLSSKQDIISINTTDVCNDNNEFLYNVLFWFVLHLVE